MCLSRILRLLILLWSVPLWSAAPLLPAGEVLPAYATLLADSSQREPVAALAFSADGTALASAAAGRALVQLWDTASGQERQRLEFAATGGSRALVLTADWLAVGFGDGTVILHAQNDDRELGFSLADPVTAIAPSPNGTQFAVAAGRTLYLLDSGSGRSEILAELADPLTALAFHPGGGALALAGGAAGTELRLWSLRSRNTLTRWLAHTAPIRALTFHPNGSLLLSAGDDGTLRLWNPDGSAYATLSGHSGPVTALALTPDGTTLLSGGVEGLRVWDLASGSQVGQFDDPGGPVRVLAFAPDGRWFASAATDGGARVWDSSTGTVIRHLRGQRTPLSGLALHPTGSVLATAAGANGLRLVDVQDGWEHARLTEAGLEPVTVAYSRDGRWLAAGLANGEVLLWDAASEQLSQRLTGHTAAVTALAFTPAGLTLAAGDAAGRLILWDVGSGAEIVRWPLEAAVTTLVMAPDGRWLAAATTTAVVIADTLSGQRLHTLPGRADALAINPDGSQLIVAAGFDLRFYDPVTASVTRTLIVPESVQALAFSADGAQLAAGGKQIRVWTVASERPPLLIEPAAEVTALVFGPDGAELVAALADSSVRLWTLHPLALRWTYLPGADANWLSCQADNRCWRHDDSQLLSIAVGGQREPLPLPTGAPATLNLAALPAALTVADGSSTPLRVTIRNDGPGRAYWLTLALTEDNNLWVFHPPLPYPLLEPGATVELEARLAVHTAYSNPGSGMTELPFALTARPGEPLPFTLPVTVTTPNPTVISTALLTGPDRLRITLGNAGTQALGALAATVRLTGSDNDLGTQHGRGLLAAGVLTLEFPLPADTRIDRDTRIDLRVWRTTHPVHVWRFTDLPVTLPLPHWLGYALAAGGLVLVVLVWRWRQRQRAVTVTPATREDAHDDADATLRP